MTQRTFIGVIKDGVVAVVLNRRPDVIARLSTPESKPAPEKKKS